MAKISKTVAILGSSGSIGKQTLEVIDKSPELFRVSYLTVNSNIEVLKEQARKYKPFGVAIADARACEEFKKNADFNGRILCGQEGVAEAASDSANDIVMSALVGFSGVKPTMAAIKAGVTVALANKETLVSAGAIISREARKRNVDIVAVDSEHSAIAQCLIGERIDEVEKLILTASGGPFFRLDKREFKNITLEMALKHPNWSMGRKITIDSATMMNKGFEVIEARWLFDLPPSKIEVKIHPESVVHSLVQFIDGSVKAQLGLPDMRIPIAFALSYPRRLKYDFPRLDLAKTASLSFFEPDLEKFPCLKLAFQAIENGGVAPTIINAANEVAVSSFLEKKIKFVDISTIIEKTLDKLEVFEPSDLEEIVEVDLKARETAKRAAEKIS